MEQNIGMPGVRTKETGFKLEHRIPPPILVVVTGAAMRAAAFFVPALHFSWLARVLVGLPLAAAGAAVMASGFLAFRKAGTTIDPVRIDRASSLVTAGVFRFTRNPMYVGMTLILLGWAAYLAVPALLLLPAGFVLFIHRFQIVPEERAMRAKYGQAFDEYTQRVRRWL